MLLVLVGLLVLAAGAVYWLVFHRPASRSRAAPREAKAAGRFGSVEIKTRAGACDAARALEGQRILSKKAPTLPLPACDAGQCSCKFVKLSDRRTDGRRLEHEGLSAAQFLAKNRRAKRDRRDAKQKSS